MQLSPSLLVSQRLWASAHPMNKGNSGREGSGMLHPLSSGKRGRILQALIGLENRKTKYHL